MVHRIFGTHSPKVIGQVVPSNPAVLSRLLTYVTDPPIRRICASPLLLIAIRFQRVLRVSDSNSLFGFLPRPLPAWPAEKGERRLADRFFNCTHKVIIHHFASECTIHYVGYLKAGSKESRDIKAEFQGSRIQERRVPRPGPQ